ncbi:MAG: thioesterase family protein [Pseudomonadota bacterium]
MERSVTGYLGSVNRWECDENDHLNVRHFAVKANEALGNALEHFYPETTLELVSQHIRFLTEARVAVPLAGRATLHGSPDPATDSVVVSVELINPVSGTLHAAFVSTLRLPPDTERHDYLPLREEAAPKGLPTDTQRFAEQSLTAAYAAGMWDISYGRVALAESLVDDDGSARLAPEHVIGRVSDGMAHLWSRVRGSAESGEPQDRQRGEFGGAALEYHIDFAASVDLGEQVRVVSGVEAYGNKTLTFRHLLYGADASRPAARMLVVAVSMDLGARRAIAIPDEQRQRLDALLLRS